MQEGARSFENIVIYLSGQSSSRGTVTLCSCPFCTFVYFRDDGATGAFPFDDPFLLSPLSPPYLEQSGHRVFNLAFYSDMTVIEQPVRLCFHDATQELGISLNFATQADFSDLFDYLKSEMTIVSPNLPGFFQIRRFRRSLPLSEAYGQRRKELKDSFLNSPANQRGDVLLVAHSELIRRLTDMIGGAAQSAKTYLPLAAVEQVREAVAESRAAVADLVRRHSVPESMKGSVWAVLIGLHPLDRLDPRLKERYMVVKRQWTTITEAQLHRSKLLLGHVNRCTRYVEANRQQFISVVAAHPAILNLTFNIFMAILRVYNFIDKHFDVVKAIFRVFLWMFVRDVAETPDQTIFIGEDGLTYDEDTLETIIFWSILYVFEAAETRRLLELPKPADHETTEAICDFIFLVYPSMFKHLHQIGVRTFDRLIPLFTAHMSTLLPLCDCLDLWLAAAASPSFLEFTQFMLIACLFFNFPNMFSLEPSADQDLQPAIEQAFEYIDHRYLATASFTLSEKAREMVRERLPPD
jgi:hypothetical protein